MDAIDSSTNVLYAVKVDELTFVYRNNDSVISFNDSNAVKMISQYKLPASILIIKEEDGVKRYIDDRVNNYYKVSNSAIITFLVVFILLIVVLVLYCKNYIKYSN